MKNLMFEREFIDGFNFWYFTNSLNKLLVVMLSQVSLAICIRYSPEKFGLVTKKPSMKT